MALPVVKTVADCADFSKTVLPYASQLRELPYQIFESISNPESLKQIYLNTNPIISAFAFSLFLVPIFLVVSEINKNYSQVDRVWSILPSVYIAHYVTYAHLVGLETKRLDTILAAVAVWSFRLTFNYWRRGGYSIGSEDYRWEVLRGQIPPPLFFVMNVLFISLAQSVLLFSITTPVYILLLTARLISSSSPDYDKFTTPDLIFSRIFIILVVLEFYADQQQWNFQKAKKQYQVTAKVPVQWKQVELDRGFVIRGLWSWSRHPNFAAEQAFWVTLYQWACWNTDTYLNWTGIGAASYLILFQASTIFTESITAKKYPDYAEYQARVGKFIPRLSTEPRGDWKPPVQPKKSIDSPKEQEQDKAKARQRYNLP